MVELALLVAVVVVLLTAALAFLLAPKKQIDSILLVGMCGAGKTSLYSRLREGRLLPTVTSMTENACVMEPGSLHAKQVRLVDLAGHPRLRSRREKYTASAKGIVVMVDAVDLLPNVNGTSELLLELFTDPVLMRKRVPVLVACNKTDRITAYSEAQVQKRLEREIQQLRSTREALTDTAEKGAKSDSLATKSKTKAGSTFKMDDAPLQVQFCEVSVLNDKVAPIREFIETC